MKRIFQRNRPDPAQTLRYAVDTGSIPQPPRASPFTLRRVLLASAAALMVTVGAVAGLATRGPAALAGVPQDCATAREAWRAECRATSTLAETTALAARQDPRPAVARERAAKRTSTRASAPKPIKVAAEAVAPAAEASAVEVAEVTIPEETAAAPTVLQAAVVETPSLASAMPETGPVSAPARPLASLEVTPPSEAPARTLRAKPEAVHAAARPEPVEAEEVVRPRERGATRFAKHRALRQAAAVEVEEKAPEKRRAACEEGEHWRRGRCRAIAKVKAEPVVLAKRTVEPVAAPKRTVERVAAPKRTVEAVAAPKRTVEPAPARKAAPQLVVKSQPPAAHPPRHATLTGGKRKVTVCVYFVVCL